MAKKKIGDLISDYMAPFAQSRQYELQRTEFVKEGGTWYLRVFVDKLTEDGYGYMSSDDCEIVSRHLSEKLDADDPIKQNYYLEVSSPGLDRPLITDRDFERFTGSRIEISLYEPLDGTKFIEGILVNGTGENVTVEDGSGKQITLSKNKASKINLAVII